MPSSGVAGSYGSFIPSFYQSLNHAHLFAVLWTAVRQASLSFTVSWSLLKLMSIELVMLSNHCILCCPLLLLPSVFPMYIQDVFHLVLTGLISLQTKGLSSIYSKTTVQKHHLFGAQLALWSSSHIHT